LIYRSHINLMPRHCPTKPKDKSVFNVITRLPYINLLKPTGYGMHQQVEYFNNCTLCPHCIYVFCICLKTNSDLCLLHKKIGFITEMNSVYSAVRTGSLYEAVCASSLKVKILQYCRETVLSNTDRNILST
jgi:hypothetical protein